MIKEMRLPAQIIINLREGETTESLSKRLGYNINNSYKTYRKLEENGYLLRVWAGGKKRNYLTIKGKKIKTQIKKLLRVVN